MNLLKQGPEPLVINEIRQADFGCCFPTDSQERSWNNGFRRKEKKKRKKIGLGIS